MSKIFKSFRLWLIAMVLLAGLAVLQHPAGNGVRERIVHLEQLVKCPSCENLSVYNSNSTSALAVRKFIESEVAKGHSDTRILTTLESQYGSTILLSPSTGGLGAILWIFPLLVVVTLGAVLTRLRSNRR